MVEGESMDRKVKCEWESEDDDIYSRDWSTECNNMFEFTDGNPTDNDFKFCPFCGGEIIIIKE